MFRPSSTIFIIIRNYYSCSMCRPLSTMDKILSRATSFHFWRSGVDFIFCLHNALCTPCKASGIEHTPLHQKCQVTFLLGKHYHRNPQSDWGRLEHDVPLLCAQRLTTWRRYDDRCCQGNIRLSHLQFSQISFINFVFLKVIIVNLFSCIFLKEPCGVFEILNIFIVSTQDLCPPRGGYLH